MPITRLFRRVATAPRMVVSGRAVALIVLACAPLVSAATWNPDPSLGNPEQHRRLYEIGRRYCETNFDADANLVGTRTKKPPNKKQHATRESAYYAYGLLLTGDAADRKLAQAVLRKVLATQDTQPQSPTCGAFNWYVEDPRPQDINSVAFVGVALAGIAQMDRQKPVLDDDLRPQVEKAIRLAVAAALRRDVEPGYTNIALLTTALAAAGDKLYSIPGAAAFAQTKMDGVLQLADGGEFSEYLSPTYYGASLDGAYRCKKFAFSPEFAAKADKVIDRFWQQIALAYHAPTYQLGGPHLRAYGNDMLEYAAGLKYFLYLALDGAYPMPDTDTDHDWDKGGLVMMADLPVLPRAEFKQQPPAWRQWTAVGSGTTPVRQLRQYREGNFILGTVAYQDEWRQKRNLVAYWRTDTTAAPGFRVGYCIDQSNESVPGGFPGERLRFDSQQVKDTALVVLSASVAIPGYGGCSTLVFDKNAKAAAAGEGSAMRIEDGAITTYLYPITTGSARLSAQADDRVFRVTRPWGEADAVGTLRVLAYVVIFRPKDAPAPVVSKLELKAETGSVIARATVDGTPLTVIVKN